MTLSQANRHFRIATPLGDDVVVLRNALLVEELGWPFELTVDLLSDDHQIAFNDILGQNVTVSILLPQVEGEEEETVRYINGYVRTFQRLRPLGRYMQYRAQISPWLWLLSRTSDCRIFQNQTLPDVVKAVFRARGFTDFEETYSGVHAHREYVVQYRETDFNFVSRLMEEEGIYYYFKHEENRHILVMTDAASSHQAYEGYEEIPIMGEDAGRGRHHTEHLGEWQTIAKVHSGAYAQNDFDFKNIHKDLNAASTRTREHAEAAMEIYDYPGGYVERDPGDYLARCRMEEIACCHTVHTASGDVRGVTPGWVFEVDDRSDSGLEGRFLTIATRTEFHTDEYQAVQPGAERQGESLRCEVTAIPADEQFRPPRTTRKPQIPGPQTAFVAGPSGEEIYTDEYGRVKVQFHWDRASAGDENSSCWIRVAQTWAGKKWGAIYTPRIGQEVIVEFLEGDPDRPIITGRTYNGQAMPPYELPAQKTVSTVKSCSSKGAGGFNEIRFEDKKGSEQVFINAQTNQDVRVGSDSFEFIGRNRHLIVKKDQFEHVENNRDEIVDADHKEKIGKDRHLKVEGKQAMEVVGSKSLTVGGDVIEVFKANHSEQTTADYYLKAMNVVIEGMTALTIKVGGNFVNISPGGVYISGSMVYINSGGAAGNGSAGSAVPPADPVKAEEADSADPGETTEIRARRREVSEQRPHREDDNKTSWIEIQLVDEEDNPVPGEVYRIILPDGQTVAEGTLDENGFARVNGIDPGTCQITFPDLDQEAWERT